MTHTCLQGEYEIQSPVGLAPSTPGHRRTESGLSNISLDSMSSVATEASTIKNGEEEVREAVSRTPGGAVRACEPLTDCSVLKLQLTPLFTVGCEKLRHILLECFEMNNTSIN